MTTDSTLAISLGAGGIGVGGVSLLAFLILSIVVWYHWRRSKGEILSLKYQLEKAVAEPGLVVDPNLIPLVPLDIQRPSSPPSQPKPIITEDTTGYSSVNKLSLLPDSVRTAENLEGGTIPTGTEGELLEKYKRERIEYEDKQLQLCEGMRVNRGVDGGRNSGGNSTMSSRPTSAPVAEKPSLRYDTVELPEDRERKIIVNDDDEYGQPVDALQEPVQTPVAAVTSKPLTDAQKKNVVNATAVGQAYTPVFTPQQPESQAGMREHRALSDLSPSRGYENAAVIPENVRKNSGGKQDGMKGVPYRRMAKEEVEFDPERQRMFRMTSKKGKSQGKIGDHTDDAGTPPEKVPVQEEREETSAVPRPAICLDYALVNVKDKQKNRIVSDVDKCEGSGVPRHIAVPLLSS